MKFSMRDDFGLNIFAAGYPASQAIDCSSSSPIRIVKKTVAASSLLYGPLHDLSTFRRLRKHGQEPAASLRCNSQMNPNNSPNSSSSRSNGRLI